MKIKIIKEVIPEIVGYISDHCDDTIMEYRCSVCGFGISEDYYYCPYCGNKFNWNWVSPYKPPKNGEFMDLFSKL